LLGFGVGGIMELHIGIDDTDSIEGMCTTYLGALLKDELQEFSTVIESRLVRLNPNIEFKTRGNAGVSLAIKTNHPERAKKLVLDAVEKYSVFEDEKTNPGVVFFDGVVPEDFNDIYRRALHEVVEIKDAENVALGNGAEIHKFKNGRGIVGALASIGSGLESSDHTYEIIAYRHRKKWGTKRKVDEETVVSMDKRTFPLTFNNFDYNEERVLIAPSSPCPVLFGIRGETPDVLYGAYGMIEPGEPVEREILYKTNQGTDAHLEEVGSIGEIMPFSSVILKGTVKDVPRTIEGGHVIFPLTDERDTIDCAAYEPTRAFRWRVRELVPGDELVVHGGVKSGTINLEKMEVIKLAENEKVENPLCPECNMRMESAGKNQGYRCKKCKTKSGEKVVTKVKRNLEHKIYQVPPCAMRHLGKPLVRF
jgi:tRNA(Ile2)-agmatinylcytidine synthase